MVGNINYRVLASQGLETATYTDITSCNYWNILLPETISIHSHEFTTNNDACKIRGNVCPLNFTNVLRLKKTKQSPMKHS